ncbi:nucleotidyltransferase family protein [Terrarubrum flagellatum]|uniref:nucleotidyltransferase family protein n=1 Tax=Terrirubrum flagellatum TaxID=2895980 RepID=UPI003144E8E3
MYLFGSAARDAAGDQSDVDLFLDYDPAARFNLFDQMKIEEMLAERLDRKVDLMTRGGLHPLIRDRVISSAIRML